MRSVLRHAAALAVLLCLTLSGARAEETGYLGLKVRALDRGARVLGVIPGSPAESAGIVEGDVILEAGGEPLAGLPIDAMTSRLKGPPESVVRLRVERFPGGGTPEAVDVRRGPPPPKDGRAAVMAAPWERLVNPWLAAARRGETPTFSAALPAGAEAEADDAFVWALARLSGPWWVGSRLEDGPRRAALWAALAEDQALAQRLAARPPSTRLRVARWMAVHAQSAAAALSLLKGLPEVERASLPAQEARRLATAVAAGDPAAVAALALQAADLRTTGGFRLAAGPSLSDLAALELASDRAGAGDPRALFSEAVAAALESSGAALPWTSQRPTEAFGHVPAAPAPPLRAERAGAPPLDLATAPGPVVVTFWASWCGPCRQELPRLEVLAQELAPSGLQVWALSLDDTEEAAAAGAKSLGITLPWALAPDDVRRAYQVGPIPRMVVLDAQKRIIRDHTGFSEVRFEEEAADLRALARGELASERVLGAAVGGAVPLTVVASGLAGLALPRAVLTGDGRVWLSREDALQPATMTEAELVPTESGQIPVPFPADLARMADLDGDGVAELVLATRGGGAIRVQGADGRPRWTTRGDDIAGMGLWRDAAGALHPVVARVDWRPLAEDGPSARDAHVRLEILDPTGTPLKTLPLPSPVEDIADDPATGRVAILFASGAAATLESTGELRSVSSGDQPARGLRYVDVDGDGAAELVVASGAAVDAAAVGDPRAPQVLALTAGGSLSAGPSAGRLRLEKRTRLASADVDGDGRPEALVLVPGFGVAALSPRQQP